MLNYNSTQRNEYFEYHVRNLYGSKSMMEYLLCHIPKLCIKIYNGLTFIKCYNLKYNFYKQDINHIRIPKILAKIKSRTKEVVNISNVIFRNCESKSIMDTKHNIFTCYIFLLMFSNEMLISVVLEVTCLH